MSYYNGLNKMPPGGTEMQDLSDDTGGEASGWNIGNGPPKVTRYTLISYLGRHALGLNTRTYEPHHIDAVADNIVDITLDDDEEDEPDPSLCTGGQYWTFLELSYNYPNLCRLSDPSNPKYKGWEIVPSELNAELEEFETERSMFIFSPCRTKYPEFPHCSSWKGPKALDKALRHVRKYHGDLPEGYKEAVKKLNLGKKALFKLLCIPSEHAHLFQMSSLGGILRLALTQSVRKLVQTIHWNT
jgi:hypothetical protein